MPRSSCSASAFRGEIKSCNAAMLADRLLADQSTGNLGRDLGWAFRHLLDAAYHRALREAREQGKPGTDIDPDVRPIIRVLVELHGPDDVSRWAEEIGRQLAGEEE
jgi:hypothetical protein